MAVVGIIPARFQSSRFPGKPLASIEGRPMIQHVYERSREAPSLDRLLVATDDERIFDTVQGFGGEALMTRSDHPSGTDRLAEAARILRLSGDDVVINVQGDEPQVQPAMIDRLVEALGASSDSPMATLAFICTNERELLDPNVVKVVVDMSGRALYFSRAAIPWKRDMAEEPVSFLKHLGFYAYRNSFLQAFTRLAPGRLEQLEKLEQLRALENGYSIQVALSPVETRGIDTPEDLERLLTLPYE